MDKKFLMCCKNHDLCISCLSISTIDANFGFSFKNLLAISSSYVVKRHQCDDDGISKQGKTLLLTLVYKSRSLSSYCIRISVRVKHSCTLSHRSLVKRTSRFLTGFHKHLSFPIKKSAVLEQNIYIYVHFYDRVHVRPFVEFCHFTTFAKKHTL